LYFLLKYVLPPVLFTLTQVVLLLITSTFTRVQIQSNLGTTGDIQGACEATSFPGSSLLLRKRGREGTPGNSSKRGKSLGTRLLARLILLKCQISLRLGTVHITYVCNELITLQINACRIAISLKYIASYESCRWVLNSYRQEDKCLKTIDLDVPLRRFTESQDLNIFRYKTLF
jgi:hypothetical protein